VPSPTSRRSWPQQVYHWQYLDTQKAARNALTVAKTYSMRDLKSKRDSWVVQKRAVSNEAVTRNTAWLNCERFPNLWPLDAMAATYLTESDKYTRRVRNGNTEVQDVPREQQNSTIRIHPSLSLILRPDHRC